MITWVAFAAAPAFATTTGGWAETSTSLAVIPGASQASFTRNVSVLGNTEVFFVQDMPVTKTINHVTLGDYGRGTTCGTSADPQVSLSIWDKPSREPRLGTDPHAPLATSLSSATFGATLGHVSWNLPQTVLHAHHGYMFTLTPTSGCSTVQQTTWSHNTSQVYTGTAPCTTDSSGERAVRMWHVSGTADRPAHCDMPDSYWNLYNFDASMPTGWLYVDEPGYSYQIPTMTQAAGATFDGRCGNHYYGGVWTFWRYHPGSALYNDYVCTWDQYADFDPTRSSSPGYTPADNAGWYYAMPWLDDHTNHSAPRDGYLSVDSIGYDALLSAHVPQLEFDSQEVYRPTLSVNAAVDNPPNSLQSSSGDPIAAHGVAGVSDLTVDLLGSADFVTPSPHYSNGDAAAETDRLDEGDNYLADATVYQDDPSYAGTVYGRPVYGTDDRLWLQYWFFYYYDPQVNDLGIGVHEGDWEMVQVRMKPDLTGPDEVTFSRHGDSDAETCSWDAVQKVNASPVTYVANQSHGNYSAAGHYVRGTFGYAGTDDADGAGLIELPALDVIDSETAKAGPNWAAWKGTWGGSGDSPPAPIQQPKWADPSGYAAGATSCLSGTGAPKRIASRLRRSLVAPSVTAKRTGRKLIVAYDIRPKAFDSGAAPATLYFTVSPHDGRLTPTARLIRPRGRKGHFTMQLPKQSGPYSLSVSAASRRGVRGPVTVYTVRSAGGRLVASKQAPSRAPIADYRRRSGR